MAESLLYELSLCGMDEQFYPEGISYVVGQSGRRARWFFAFRSEILRDLERASTAPSAP